MSKDFKSHLLRLLFIIMLFHLTITAQESQQKKLLKQQIDTISNPKLKVQAYADLSWEYIMEENDSALIHAQKALEFSEKNNYKLGQAIALETHGLYHEIVEGNFGEASSFYFKAIAVCETNNLDYDRSLYHTLAVMFHMSDSYEKALEYYKKSYELAIKANDSVLIKKCLINLGSVNSSIENYDKAISYMEKSFDYDIRQNMDYTTSANLGYLYSKQKEYDKALPYLLKATEQHPDNPDSEGNLYFLLYLKAETKDTTGMQPILKRAKTALSTTVGPREKSLLLRNLADYYKSTGNYKEAITYRDQYIQVFEDIKAKQRDETVYELETKYETAKKDAELLGLQIEAEKKEQQRQLYLYLFIGGVCIAGLTGFFLYKNRKKKILLAKQKRLLEATLDEKNVLLREVHHRVKNSFQIVSSLLYLQSENIEDKEAKLAIKEAENRVRSMVLVHQKLYNRDELVGINATEYVNDLVKDIFESHQLQDKSIIYNLDIDPLVLNIETVTPLGLIINELIINTLKHAFKGIEENNKINVSFAKANNELVLKIADNGRGFEGKINSSSFGISLMKALSKKLKATLTYDSKLGQGTEAVLRIKKFTILS